MSLRARIFIIVSILVLLVLGISIFLIVGNKNKNSQPQTGAPQNNSSVVTGTGQPGAQTTIGAQAPAGLPAKVATPLETEKNGAQQLAKVFLERYGTYSSDNNFQNIKDVETLVTRSLWSKISAPISSKTTAQSFVGVTTKVVSMDLTAWSDAKAVVEFKTMRVEERNGVVNTKYQNATVVLIKQGSSWLVDTLVWN